MEEEDDDALHVTADATATGRGLFINGQPLFCEVLDSSAYDSRAELRAWGRLAAEALDSVVGVDGKRPVSRKAAFGSLRESFACLLALGARACVRPVSVGTPGVVPLDDGAVVVVHGPWSVTVLSDGVSKRGRYSDVRCSVVHSREGGQDGFAVEVRGRCPPPLLVRPAIEWGRVAWSNEWTLEVGETRDDGDAFAVSLYRSGILWERDDDPAPPCSLRGLHLHIDTSDERFPVPDRMDVQGCDVFARIFLQVDTALGLCRSAVVRRLLAKMVWWREVLWKQWRPSPTEALAALAMEDDLCDELAAFLDASLLVHHAVCKPQIEQTGLVLMRRMRSTSIDRAADLRASALSEHGVERVLVVPVDAARFAKLHALDCFRRVETPVSPHGMVHHTGDAKHVLVPKDVDASRLTMALVTLLACPPIPAHDETDRQIVLPFSSLLSEGATTCVPNEVLRAHRVAVDEDRRAVVLTQQAHTRRAQNVRAVDEMEGVTLPCDRRRMCRARIAAHFPALARRMELQHHRLDACYLEVQARRVVHEWSLEGLDDTHNLSSLGMSILVCLLLHYWHGCKVRVFLSTTRAALAGICLSETEEYTLVDPTVTVRNAFELSRSMMTLTDSGRDLKLRAGIFVEVKQHKRWALAEVVQVVPHNGLLRVRYVENNRVDVVNVRLHAWRALAREGSNVDKVLRRLVRLERATPQE